MMTAVGIGKAPEIKKQLLFAEAISLEIQEAGKEKRNKKKSIRTILSGKILKKYKLLSYTASKTGTDRRKMSSVTGKVLCEENQKRGFEPELHGRVLDFTIEMTCLLRFLANVMPKIKKREGFSFKKGY